MEINISKTKEMVLGRLANINLPLPNIASQTVERVTTYKLFGVHIDSTLSWSTHIEYIIKKATTRLYFLKQLKRVGLPIVTYFIRVRVKNITVSYNKACTWILCASVALRINKSAVWEPGGCSKARYPYYTQPNPRNAVFIHAASCKSGFVGCT